MKCYDCGKELKHSFIEDKHVPYFRNRFYAEQGWVSIVLCADCERDCIGMAMIMDTDFGGE